VVGRRRLRLGVGCGNHRRACVAGRLRRAGALRRLDVGHADPTTLPARHRERLRRLHHLARSSGRARTHEHRSRAPPHPRLDTYGLPPTHQRHRTGITADAFAAMLHDALSEDAGQSVRDGSLHVTGHDCARIGRRSLAGARQVAGRTFVGAGTARDLARGFSSKASVRVRGGGTRLYERIRDPRQTKPTQS
jgi:hypothetical protein